MVAHASNPSHSGGTDLGGLWFETSAGRNLASFYLDNKPGMVVCIL
jgi:hypothetical protein